MKNTLKYLSHLIALLVVFQAAVAVWSVAEEITAQSANPGATATPPLGAIMHGMVGMFVIPAAALILLVLALIARTGRLWAGLTLASAVLQVLLGIGGLSVTPYLGLLHGINAFVLVAMAELTARAAARAEAAEPHVARHQRHAQPVG
ncbi:hypothetical protein [Raineyella fluvialis]|uniref:Uncharacterized protein n=1 Tax=Raineyella fluvialis TaxID=2662261 RepID=A0A5Q2F7J2_9ACTN|nr:hypothetical protein [Raineyella fluvialis]QGF22892.1 hypothetical protein Rai3103_03540 [Raineyella fluvialis]